MPIYKPDFVQVEASNANPGQIFSQTALLHESPREKPSAFQNPYSFTTTSLVYSSIIISWD
jgi:hypothetical protein